VQVPMLAEPLAEPPALAELLSQGSLYRCIALQVLNIHHQYTQSQTQTQPQELMLLRMTHRPQDMLLLQL
jgi:hypothetical protein